MNDHFHIDVAVVPADVKDVARLFEQYASTLPLDLSYQNFDAELSGLPGKYAAPLGALLISRTAAGDASGCVGIRPLPEVGTCEMKRLFTVPSTRGSGLGTALAQAAIEKARTIGYERMTLDTLSTMKAALGLYEKLGFRRSPAYYSPTPADTIFMALRL